MISFLKFPSISFKRTENFEEDHIAANFNRKLLNLAQEAEIKSLRPKDLSTYFLLNSVTEFLESTNIENKTRVYEELERNLLAVKLGISPVTMQNNVGFEEFAIKNRLVTRLVYFDHRLEISQEGDIMLQVESGVSLPWKFIRDERSLIDQDGKLVGRYGYKGISKESERNWVKLPVFKVDNPEEWKCQYIFEICVRCPKSLRGIGDHVWFRLKNPVGEIYSVGMTSDLSPEWKNRSKLLRVTKAFLISPEYYEFCPDKENCVFLAISITANQFAEIKRTIEKDQREKKLIFQIFQNNCTTYVCKKIGTLAGIHFSNLERYYPSILCSILASKLESMCPSAKTRNFAVVLISAGSVIEKLVPRTFLAWSMNWLSLCCGAAQTDSDQKVFVTPLISSFRDFCDPEKALFSYPSECRELIEKIISWRQRNPGNDYAVPKQFIA